VNKIVSDWDTLPKGVKVMTIIGAVLTAIASLAVVANIDDGGVFLLAILYIGYYGWIFLLFPGVVSRAARTRGGRMLKWYLFAFCLAVFLPIVGMVAVVVYYKYFWCGQHPVISTAKDYELAG
jgi:hypothetical protein